MSDRPSTDFLAFCGFDDDVAPELTGDGAPPLVLQATAGSSGHGQRPRATAPEPGPKSDPKTPPTRRAGSDARPRGARGVGVPACAGNTATAEATGGHGRPQAAQTPPQATAAGHKRPQATAAAKSEVVRTRLEPTTAAALRRLAAARDTTPALLLRQAAYRLTEGPGDDLPAATAALLERVALGLENGGEPLAGAAAIRAIIGGEKCRPV